MERKGIESIVRESVKPIKATPDIGNILIERMFERYRDGEACEDVKDFFESDAEEFQVPVFMGNGRRKQRTVNVDDGVSLSSDGGDGGLTQIPGPPPANRGATFHGSDGSSETLSDDCPYIMGGYDGGTTVGFDGKWSEGCFESFRPILDKAKEAALLGKEHPDRIFEYSGRYFSMYAKSTGGEGVTYNYVFEGGGVKFYVHSRPAGDIQPVRVCYAAEGLIGRDLFLKHAETLGWLKAIGFEVHEEKISRVDLQVMLYRDVSEFMAAFSENRVCCKARKYAVNGDGFNRCSSGVRIGGKHQIAIYDKRDELFLQKNDIKRALMVQNCFGDDWLTQEIPTTRVEFRIQRDVLKDKGINTMDDLLTREADLVRYCTHDWFRMLADPKRKGHTHEQETSELWQEVQAAFQRWFPGAAGHNEEIERGRKPKTVRCDMRHLARQVEGCLKTIIAKSFGVVRNVEEAMTIVYQVVGQNTEDIFVGSVQRAREFMASKFEPPKEALRCRPFDDRYRRDSFEYGLWDPDGRVAGYQPFLSYDFYD